MVANFTFCINSSHCSNFSKSRSNSSQQESEYNILLWAIVTLFVCLIGCFNNILVLYASWPRSGEKSGVNLLILHFIIANFLNVLIHYPVRCIMVIAKIYGHSSTVQACPLIQIFNTVNWLVVFWADTGLSINRCVALFFPHHYKGYSSKRKNVLQIVAIWAVALAMTLPYNFGFGTITLLPIGYCAIRNATPAYQKVFDTGKNTSFVVGGVAAVLILGKCCVMARAGGQLGLRGQDRAVRTRIRMALFLVVTYFWTVLSSMSTYIILRLYPMVFERNPDALIWLQTAAISQYALSATPSIATSLATGDYCSITICFYDNYNNKLYWTPIKWCFILFSSKKYSDRLRWIVRRVRPVEQTISRIDTREGVGHPPHAVQMDQLN